MSGEREPTRDGVEILHRLFIDGDPEAALELEKCRLDQDVGQALYNLRKEAGLTQQELAKRVGTSHSNISRLEDADYEGHSMAMLRRIAAALGKRVVVGFVDIEGEEPIVQRSSQGALAGKKGGQSVRKS